jgi:hypothetical protein
MFSCDIVKKIIFIEGVYLKDFSECEPENIPDCIQPTPEIICNLCPICNINKTDPQHFVIGLIERTNNNQYRFQKSGHDNFCSQECLIIDIRKKYNRLDSFGLIQNLKFYNSNNNKNNNNNN